MTVEPEQARELALALPETSEAPHFHRLAFRTPRKIFATLDRTARDLNLMFDPELRDFYCDQAPQAFTPVQEAGDAMAQLDASLLRWTRRRSSRRFKQLTPWRNRKPNADRSERSTPKSILLNVQFAA